jgi:hypothetical protein
MNKTTNKTKVLAWKLVWSDGQPPWQFPAKRTAWARNVAAATGAVLARTAEKLGVFAAIVVSDISSPMKSVPCSRVCEA